MLARSAWGYVIPRCIDVWLVQLKCSSMTSGNFKFRNRTWRDFLQGFVELPWLHFQALNHMKPRRERSDGVGLDSLGGFSSSFRAHGKEGLVPVSDKCWMLHQDSCYVRTSRIFPEITSFFCWCRHSFSLFNICVLTWVDLWFVDGMRALAARS